MTEWDKVHPCESVARKYLALFRAISVADCVVTCSTCILVYHVRHRYLALWNRLAGLVVKASASGAEDPRFESRLRRDFPGPSLTSDLKIGTPVATLPGAWPYRVSAGTGRPGVSIL